MKILQRVTNRQNQSIIIGHITEMLKTGNKKAQKLSLQKIFWLVNGGFFVHIVFNR